jgi:RNA polymerase sigma-70 factor (ECF subfamily)
VPEPPEPGPPAEDATLNAELHTQLQAALNQLPEEQRTAVVLCDVEGLDYTEIAAVMNTSLGTVKSRIARGRLRLRELLRREPELLTGRFRQEI